MKNPSFYPKRSLNLTRLKTLFQPFFRQTKIVLKNTAKPSIPHKFVEHIMLAVTAVNGCVMCTWAHTDWAIDSGCSVDEVRDLLSSDFSKVPDSEIIALQFAQHYADKEGKPSKQALKQLIGCYGREKAESILVQIYMIMIGNIFGNSIEAFEYRLRGTPSQDGNWFLEFLVFLFGYPMKLKMRDMGMGQLK